MNPLPVLVFAGLCILLATAGGALAQNAAPPPLPAAATPPPVAPQSPTQPQAAPQKLEPLPEIPRPEGAADAELEPQVTVVQKNGDRIEEARVNGALVWIKVTPRTGVPYYLIPTGHGANTYVRANSLDTALSVPMWQLFTW
jgi:hypothetical protein